MLDLSHPELKRRYDALVSHCWANGWEIWIGSSTRDYATQADLYQRWLDGSYKVPSVANPDLPHGPCPQILGGWTIKGSYHMPQADNYSHALDLGWRGCSEYEFEALANLCGLQQAVPNENWHYQWFNKQVMFQPDPTSGLSPYTGEDDQEMDQATFAKYLAASLSANEQDAKVIDGVVHIKLFDHFDGATPENPTGNGTPVYGWFPYAATMQFTHQSMKYAQLGIK